MDIDLNLLAVFQHVYRERQISAAARRLGLTQSAVSNALARLRKTFGDELFVRTAQGMQPTPFAEQLAEPIGAALAHVALALNYRSGFDPASSERTFTIALTDVGEVYFMPVLIERCRRLAPGVRVRSVRAGSIALKEEMETGRVDVAIGAFDDMSEALFQRHLFRQRFVTLLRAGHPLMHGAVDIERFVGAAHLLVEAVDSPYDRINGLLAKAGVVPAASVPHFTAVPYIVGAGDLVVTVPQSWPSAPPRHSAWRGSSRRWRCRRCRRTCSGTAASARTPATRGCAS